MRGRTYLSGMSVFMTLFLVLVLPACWYGALTQAWLTNAQGPSSSNSYEERDEHEERDEQQKVVHRSAPPTPPQSSPQPSPSLALVGVIVSRTAPAITASVAPQLHPSQFSVRRLI